MARARISRARRALFAATGALIASASVVAVMAPAGAAATPVTVVTVENQTLKIIDYVAGNSSFIQVTQDGKSQYAIVVSKDHIALGTNCRYLWQTDNDPRNDTAPGYDKWAKCSSANYRYEMYLGDGDDDVALTHKTAGVYVVGGPGNDTIKVWDGAAEIYGDNGPGEFFPPLSAGGNDTLVGGGDNDYIYGGGGADGIRGLQGDDRLIGSDGRDAIDGGLGKDYIDGGKDFDTVNGQGGVDTLKMRDGEQDEITCNGDSHGGRAVVDILEWDRGLERLIGCDLETGGQS